MAQDDNIDQIKKLIESAKRNLERADSMLGKLDPMGNKPDYSNVPGVEGTFDGSHLVAADGSKYEVPANYAAKSRLVYGDKLKMIEEEGKTLFKQIEKVDRKKVDGVLNKKEGKWYIITDAGSYKISDTAAEFNKVEINDKASAYVPTSPANAPFAALDKVMNKNFAVLNMTQSDPGVKSKTSPKEPDAKKPTPAVELKAEEPEASSVAQVEEKPRPEPSRAAAPVQRTARAESPRPGPRPRPKKPAGRAPKREFVRDIARADDRPQRAHQQPAYQPEPEVQAPTSAPQANITLEDDDLR